MRVGLAGHHGLCQTRKGFGSVFSMLKSPIEHRNMGIGALTKARPFLVYFPSFQI